MIMNLGTVTRDLLISWINQKTL